MPLLNTVLQQELLKILSPSTQIYPDTKLEGIWNFANAINTYASTIAPPSINVIMKPTTIVDLQPKLSSVAMDAFISVMNQQTILSEETAKTGVALPSLSTIFQLSLTAYVTQLAIGMLPAFSAILPTLPVNLEPAFEVGINGGETSQIGTMMANIIDMWFRTGMAVNTASGVTIMWI